jgi:hypothetical protein
MIEIPKKLMLRRPAVYLIRLRESGKVLLRALWVKLAAEQS